MLSRWHRRVMSATTLPWTSTRSAALPGSMRAERVESAQELGAVAGAGSQRVQRVDAELDHQRQLARVVAVAVERRASVGAQHQPHPGLIRARKLSSSATRTCAALAIAQSATLLGGASRKPCAEHSVAEKNVPRSFIRPMISSVINEPCSIESTPARTAALIPSDAVRVRGHGAAGLVRLLDPDAQLLVGQLLRARLHARRHHPAGGDQLDAVRAGLELFADGLAHVVRPVGLAADPGAVAAGHADGQVGGHDARALDDARGLRVAQGGSAPGRPPRVRTVVKPAWSVLRAWIAARQQLRAYGLLDLGQPVRSTAHGEVDVAVDQAGQQRGVGRIDARRARTDRAARSTSPRRCDRLRLEPRHPRAADRVRPR